MIVDSSQCTNDMTFSISADTDNHRYNPIFISADTDKKPIQIFLYRPIPIPITDITSFVIYAFFIMLNVYFLASKLGDAGGANTPTHFCPSRGFLLWISIYISMYYIFWRKIPENPCLAPALFSPLWRLCQYVGNRYM